MIYVFLAPGFEEIEALAVVDVLRRAELEVRMVGVGGKDITGAHGIAVRCDITDAQAVTDGLNMVVLPGGMPGTLNLGKSPIVRACAEYCVKNDKWLAAICAAPSALGRFGLIEGKKVTCYPGFESQLGGAVHTGGRVVRDGRLITAIGPGAALEFALDIVRCLLGEGRAAGICAAMHCPEN